MSPWSQKFIELLSLSTRQAGAVASYLQGKVTVEEKPDEPTPEGQALTPVDLATQDLILHQLRAQWPEVAVDAEEDTPLAHQFPHTSDDQPLIVLDPVDGTFNYSRGSPEYAVMAGLIYRAKFRAAVVFYPSLDATFWAAEGRGCFVVRGDSLPQQVELSSSPADGQLIDRILVNTKVPESNQTSLKGIAAEVTVCRCSAYDSACLALGNATASVAGARTDRRRAIPLYLSLAAGGTIRLGEQIWEGEDPATLPAHSTPTICAPDPISADRILAAYSR